MNDLLSGLDDIPWSKLLAVYDLAEGVPVALRVLATSTSEPDIAAAAEYLSNELEHQDSITQATPFATPFLVRLLSAPSLVATPKVLSLLELFYLAAQCVLESHAIEPGDADAVEKYRADATTLWTDSTDTEGAHDHERFSQEELFAWDHLVMCDVASAHDAIHKLSLDPRPGIRDAANSLLGVVQRSDA